MYLTLPLRRNYFKCILRIKCLGRGGGCSFLLMYVSSFFCKYKTYFFFPQAFKHIRRIQNGLKCLQNGILMI